MALPVFARGLHFSQIRYFQKSFRTSFKHLHSLQRSRQPLSETLHSVNPLLSTNCKFGHLHFKHVRNLVTKRSNVLRTCKRASLSFMRSMSQNRKSTDNRSAVLYICAGAVVMLGMSYAAVPLYRIFCQATGIGGQATRGHDDSKVETMEPIKSRVITVKFNADIASSMRWNFHPQQSEVKVAPGETALAFYTAKNPTEVPIVGISTYNVVPFDAGLYFNKIQCFCFEEQILNPHEEVDMPVFFFIDPDYVDDPNLEGVDTIMLSYCFFEAKDGIDLPVPNFTRS